MNLIQKRGAFRGPRRAHFCHGTPKLAPLYLVFKIAELPKSSIKFFDDFHMGFARLNRIGNICVDLVKSLLVIALDKYQVSVANLL